VEFGGVRRGGWSKAIILNDEDVYAFVEGLAKMRDAVCSGEPIDGFKSFAFRLNVTRSRRIPRIYLDSQYISLTLPDIEYLARIFNVVQQELRDYIVAMPNLLSYVTTALIH